MGKSNNSEVSAVEVFLERRKSREKIGVLSRIKIDGKNHYEFIYNDEYLLKQKSIPLGPEFPLTQNKFLSRKLFPSFEDRIPSRKNPAYAEYCKSVGISVEETNPMVLLTTIGRKGPSSFVFEPRKYASSVKSDIADYRRKLGLTIREFAAVFGTSAASVQKIERNQPAGKELIKRLKIYLQFPEVARWEILNNRAQIHDDKFHELQKRIKN